MGIVKRYCLRDLVTIGYRVTNGTYTLRLMAISNAEKVDSG